MEPATLIATAIGIAVALFCVLYACLVPLISRRHWSDHLYPEDPCPSPPSTAPEPDFTGSPFTGPAGKPASSAPAATPPQASRRATSTGPKSGPAASSTAPASSPPSAVADELPIELLGGHADGVRLAIAPDKTRLVTKFPPTGERVIYARTCLQTRRGRIVFRATQLLS